ncbi:hypothetical protein [Catellatospora chokoriensis]|uniref:Uncharacterized protein n=1 Tax=Catellatospora chokoriensis TaxID=310353 RepID=A0A8J3K1H1_9ACTN|nr:hypothetical protein [Catellatospora chokoriensis]GIF87709.1 hypothetical protein Cch02nite_11530 [Catellatospora chokoriensis]
MRPDRTSGPGPSRLRDLGFAAVVFALAMTLEVAGALTVVPPDAAVFVFVGVWAVAVGVFFLGLGYQEVTGWVIVFALVSFFIMLTPAFAVQDAVLGARGEHVSATVVAVAETGGDNDNLLYTLARPDGGQVPGQLEAHDGFTVGSVVDVVVDPRGLVRPGLAGEVGEGSLAGVICSVLLFYAVLLAVTWFVVRDQHRLRAPAVVPSDGTRVPEVPATAAPGRLGFLALPAGQVVVGLVLAGGALFLLIPGVRELYTTYRGVPGTVAVAACDEHFGADTKGFTCHGPFTADDGSIRLDRVTLLPDLDSRPTGPVPARVPGGSADQAVADGYDTWTTQLFGGTAMGVLAVVALVAVVRGLRARREPSGRGG